MFGLKRLIFYQDVFINSFSRNICSKQSHKSCIRTYYQTVWNIKLQPSILNRENKSSSSCQKMQKKYLSVNMPSTSEEFRHLDYNQLIETRNKEECILIDVREKEELAETGSIPGAHHIPVGDIAKALSTPDDKFKEIYCFDKPPQNANVIFSCRSGKRSLAALEVALANGFVNAKHYKGGFLDWEKNTSEQK